MVHNIIKRDGRVVLYDQGKIAAAILKAMEAAGEVDSAKAVSIAYNVGAAFPGEEDSAPPTVEEIQDTVERELMRAGCIDTAKKYILYRASRTRVREMNSDLMKVFDELTFTSSKGSDIKRDNANVDGDTAMGVMLKYGTEASKDYYAKYLLTEEQATAHAEGYLHIHDFDFYALTTTCCQIDLIKLFSGGFSTGHGFLREPNDIQSYAALACIAIQSNQNDQHGGQSVPNFDYGLAKGVTKTYKRRYAQNIAKFCDILMAANIAPGLEMTEKQARAYIKELEETTGLYPTLENYAEYQAKELPVLTAILGSEEQAKLAQAFAAKNAAAETDRATYQAMEALVHNLNTMHSRAGAQTPFSSINYGTDTTPEGRLVIKNIMLATEQGLGQGETPIFPIQIFRVKEGVNYNPEDPNYDLFRLACRVSAKRLFPNFSFQDAPFNLQYYKEGQPETEICYMGCRTRVMANSYDPEHQVSYGRGNLSFTSINLPRLAIEANGDEAAFYESLRHYLELACGQLLDRFAIQSKKTVRNFPVLMGQGVWLGSENLGPDDEVGEVLKHGTLSVGFIGLAEVLVALYGQHHGESETSRRKGLEIVGYMRDFLDRKAELTGLNFSLLATPAEGLSGRFVRIDAKKYGVLPGITDREYYTNSFHVPVYYPIGAFDKIAIEAPYHTLTNAGHISYVELDGDTAQNVEAFEAIVRAMHDAGVGYGSINHPVDRDPVCGYNGIIGDECPGCGRRDGEGAPVERIRRITGYLVGTMDRWNNAKQAEEKDRVKHGLETGDDSTVGEGVPFERIRRITGYLVGTMDRWNNAKQAEEKDRVKHDMAGGQNHPSAAGAPAQTAGEF